MAIRQLYHHWLVRDLSVIAVSDDFETNAIGTINELCLKSMALKLALAHIDALQAGESKYSKESQERIRVLDQIRAELPVEQQTEGKHE